MKTLICIVSLILFEVIACGAQQYQRGPAVTYSNLWCGGNRNSPPYADYWRWERDNHGRLRRVGVDCANFVSQCLIAGGMQMCDSWVGSQDLYQCFPLAFDLKKYLEKHARMRQGDASCLDQGDVVIQRIVRPDGRVSYHAMFVNYVSGSGQNKTVHYNAHTHDRCDQNLSVSNNFFYYHILPQYKFYSDWDYWSAGYYWYNVNQWVYNIVDPLTAAGANPNNRNEQYRGWGQFTVQGMPSGGTIWKAFIRFENTSFNPGTVPLSIDINQITSRAFPPPVDQLRGGNVYVTNARIDRTLQTFVDVTNASTDIMNANNNNPDHYFGTGLNAAYVNPPQGTPSLHFFDNNCGGFPCNDLELRVLIDDCSNPLPQGGKQGNSEEINQNQLLKLSLAAPTPFAINTQISYQLPNDCDIELNIYDVKGSKIKTLLSQRQQTGRHSVVWDGRTDAGIVAPGGVYFLRLEALGTQKVLRTVLVR